MYVDFGAIGNDSHDDTLAFRAALNSIRPTGGNCLVPAGTYKISESGITGDNIHRAVSDNMHLVGEVDASNNHLSILHVHGMALKTILTCGGDNWSIEKLTIQMSGIYEQVNNVFIPGAGPLQVLGASKGWTIDNCKILDTGHFASVLRGNNFNFINNVIMVHPYTFGQGAHPLHEGIIFQPVGSDWPSSSLIFNNVLTGVGFNIGGDNLSFIRNTVHQPGSGAGFFSKGEPFNHDCVFIGNNVSFGQEGTDDAQNGAFFQVEGYEIWSSLAMVLQNTASDNCGAGFVIGGRNSVVAFNRAIDNGRNVGNPSHGHRAGFSAHGLTPPNNPAISASNSIFIGNVATDTRPVGQKTQNYGFAGQQAARTMVGVAIIGNNFHGNELGEGDYQGLQPNVSSFVGRDLYANFLDPQQKDTLWSLLDKSKYTISDQNYVLLNQVLTGASLDLPVEAPIALDATALFNNRFTAHWRAGRGATGYFLDVSKDPTFLAYQRYVTGFRHLDVGNVNLKVVNGLSANVTYYYRVQGYNPSYTGPVSNTITVVTPT